MAGIAITCVLVPINKVVADKISKLSSEMMLAKDKRVSYNQLRIKKVCLSLKQYFR